MMKRVLIALLAFMMTISSVVYADGAGIKDLDKSSSYARDSIAYLVQEAIVKGDENGNFNPKKPITRAEMVVLLVKVMDLDTSAAIAAPTFKDVPLNNWASKYVEAAYKEGMVTGISSTEFKPNEIITREQMAAMLIRALKLVEKDTDVDLNNINAFADKDKIASWAKKEIEIAIEAGLMNGVTSNTFEPKKQANKEQAAVVIERLMKNSDEIKWNFKGMDIDEQSAKLSLNGEDVVLYNKVIIQDNKLFLPVEYLNKFIISVNADDQEEDAAVIQIMPSSDYRNSNMEFIWYQIGNKNAYTNASENPFAGASAGTGTKINLEAAPIQIDGVSYIPAKELFDILGITYSFDSSSNKVIISDRNIGQNPNLFYALKLLTYYDYIGDMKAYTIRENVDSVTKEVTTWTYESNSKKSDHDTASLYVKTTMKKTGLPTKIAEYNGIIIDNTIYSKNSPETKWSKAIYKRDTPLVLFTSFYDPTFEAGYVRSDDMNEILYRNFQRIETKKVGTVNISGIPATKYVMEFDVNTIKNTVSAEEYAVIKEWADTQTQGKLNYVYEFYVAQDNIIKQTFKFDVITTDPETGNKISYETATSIYYKNIGKNPVITAPEAAQIK